MLIRIALSKTHYKNFCGGLAKRVVSYRQLCTLSVFLSRSTIQMTKFHCSYIQHHVKLCFFFRAHSDKTNGIARRISVSADQKRRAISVRPIYNCILYFSDFSEKRFHELEAAQFKIGVKGTEEPEFD